MPPSCLSSIFCWRRVCKRARRSVEKPTVSGFTSCAETTAEKRTAVRIAFFIALLPCGAPLKVRLAVDFELAVELRPIQGIRQPVLRTGSDGVEDGGVLRGESDRVVNGVAFGVEVN